MGARCNVALTIATKRVVVKRPANADYLAEIKPQTLIKAKNHRLDLYLIHRQ
jgi:16S rRNA (guanine1516-N2)-methyltransferase